MIKFSMPRKTPESIFLRFGRWSSRSYNAMTGEQEKGVSVYRAKIVDGVVKLDDWISSQLSGQGRLVFPVVGEVVGTGSDGEPVLRRVRAVGLAIDHTSIPSWVKK